MYRDPVLRQVRPVLSDVFADAMCVHQLAAISEMRESAAAVVQLHVRVAKLATTCI